MTDKADEMRKVAAEKIAALKKQLKEARAELRSHERSFNLRWAADRRAIKRWRAEKPDERKARALMLPDHADLVVWLLGKLQAAEAGSDVRNRFGTVEANILTDMVERFVDEAPANARKRRAKATS